jgi:hypothetical protein
MKFKTIIIGDTINNNENFKCSNRRSIQNNYQKSQLTMVIDYDCGTGRQS